MPVYPMQYNVSELHLSDPLFETFHFVVHRGYGVDSYIERWYVKQPAASFFLTRNGEWINRYDDRFRNGDVFNDELWTSLAYYDTVEEAFEIAYKYLPEYRVNGNTLKDAIDLGYVG